MNNIVDLDTTNVQKAIEDLKAQLDAAIVFLSNTVDAYYSSHIAQDIDLAHPNGLLPGSRITAGSITGSKIALGTITIDHLDFDLATQVELDAHVAADIATAHPSGTFPIARLDTDVATQAELDTHISTDIATAHPDGYFPIARLDTDVATQAELDTHVSTSMDVHGIGSTSSVVGTLTIQTLTNKTITSDFDGKKITLYTTSVSAVERDLYSSSLYSANQFEVRQPSTTNIAAVDNTGPSTKIIVADSTFFSDVEGSANKVEFVIPPSLVGILATVSNIPDSTTLELDAYYPSITTSHLLINKLKAEPLFYIDVDGSVRIKELHVETGYNDITFDEDVLIQGNLSVSGTTSLQNTLSVTGALTLGSTLSSPSISSSLTSTNILSTNTSLSNNLTVGNSATISNDLTIGDQLSVSGNSHIYQSEVIDGYLSVGQSANVAGNLNVANFIYAGGGIYTGGTISADGLLSSKGGIYTDGYSLIYNDLVVNGNLTVTGNIANNGTIDAYDVLIQPITNSTSADVQTFLEEQVGEGGLLEQAFTLVNNQVAPANITGLVFDPTKVRSTHIEYSIYRRHTSPATELASVGTIRMIYKNISNTWSFDETFTGDVVGVTFSVTSLGQVQYTSTNLPGSIADSTMKFKARTTKQ
jgi:hypothetical protein